MSNWFNYSGLIFFFFDETNCLTNYIRIKKENYSTITGIHVFLVLRKPAAVLGKR
jgi:hypothetical protein